MARPFVAANWKMHPTISEAQELVSQMRGRLLGIEGVEKVLCPPFTGLAAVKEAIAGTSLKLGAQNMHHQERGAFTGEVSPLMVAELCEYVILGHSERRIHFGEGDELINLKVKAAFQVGLHPILCVGEHLEERDQGQAETTVMTQLRNDLREISRPDGLVIAYEPVWAIGTGRPATGETAEAIMAHIRSFLAGQFGSDAAQGIPLLYGGSVSADNIEEFARQPSIDGALVGGASLKPDQFVEIVKIVARTGAAAG